MGKRKRTFITKLLHTFTALLRNITHYFQISIQSVTGEISISGIGTEICLLRFTKKVLLLILIQCYERNDITW